MEDGPDPVEMDPNPGSATRADLRAQGDEQLLDVCPWDVGRNRLAEDRGQGLPVPPPQPHGVILRHYAPNGAV